MFDKPTRNKSDVKKAKRVFEKLLIEEKEEK